MSYFLHNEGCPRCIKEGNDQARDNLAIYSDGHKWCFRCGYYDPGDIIERHREVKKITNSKGLVYPDITPFSHECLAYLSRFSLTNEEIYGNLNGHEDGYSFFDSKFFLIRRLEKKPKVIVKGDVVGNEPLFRCQDTTDTIVLVEDVLSAIKVSRVADSCALLKTAVHDVLLYRLASLYNNCVLWLDPDMHEHMTNKLLPRVKPYFNTSRIVMSKVDPKYLPTSEIKKYLA